jgi:uncharacterized protein YutE (UPF0331/DUF86 family)
MRPDPKRVKEKVEFIQKNLAKLQKLRRLSEEEFLGDFRNVDAAMHELQVSLEAMLDLLSHIIARLRLGAPTNDAETLDLAREHGLIAEDHHRRFFQMHKFRNLVVHGYLKVDDKRIYKILRESYGDFELFLADVNRIIETERVKEANAKRKKANNKNKK